MKNLHHGKLARMGPVVALAAALAAAAGLSRQEKPMMTRTVVIDNERTTVIETTVEPGGVIPRHRHERDAVIVILEGGQLTETLPDGARNTNDLQQGRVHWRAKGHEHEEQNTGKTRLRVLLVELKD